MVDLTAVEFSVVLLVFRVIFGLSFAAHGWAKRFSGGRIEGTAAWFDSIGMRPGRLHAHAASLTEMAAGLGLAMGLLTPVAAAACVAVMVVAGYTVHRGSFFIVSDGWEYTLMVALMAAVIAGLGPGQYSLDHALGLDETLNGFVGFGIAIGIGVLAGIGQIVTFFRPPNETD